jgi:L-ascorbate metabolism protein UlaG (beta-lactamase superfamily)
VAQHQVRITFIGNATMLVECGPFRFLTDPNFLHRGQYAYLGWGLVSKRLTEPAISPRELPPLDGILLSHLHGDHWDREARRNLDRTLPVVTTPHAARRLSTWHGFRRSVGLATWQQHQMQKDEMSLTITSMPGQHAPGVAQALLPPVMGSMLELGPVTGQTECRLYISGDTLMYGGLKAIPVRYPRIDIAVLHLGGTTLPGGLLVTMDGAQGAELLDLLRPGAAMPVHYDDYSLFRSPLSAFKAEVERRGLTDRVRYAKPGETVAFSTGLGARTAT